MQPWHGAAWGCLGGAVVEAYDTLAVLRATRRWPWLDPTVPRAEWSFRQRCNAFGVWLFAVALRLGAGAGTASAASGQVTGELAAFALGVAGPLALERILVLAHLETAKAPVEHADPATKRSPTRRRARAAPSTQAEVDALGGEASDAV